MWQTWGSCRGCPRTQGKKWEHVSLKFIGKKNANNHKPMWRHQADADQSTSSGNAESWLPFSHVRSTKPQKISNTRGWWWLGLISQWDYHFEEVIWVYASANYRNSLTLTLRNLTYRKKIKHKRTRGIMQGIYYGSLWWETNPQTTQISTNVEVGVYNMVIHTLSFA